MNAAMSVVPTAACQSVARYPKTKLQFVWT
jgi:hypothetical protein